MSDVLASNPEPASAVEQWIQGARHGSRDDLGKALEACRHYLLMVANKNFPAVLRPEEGPSDLVQKTITQGLNRFEKFSGTTKAELLAWLKRILFNLTANELKRKRRQPSLESLGIPDLPAPVVGSERPPLENLIARDDHARLAGALAELSEEDQQILHLRNWERLPFREIAARLGKPSADAARKQWARVVTRLSELLGPDDAQQ